ncbi:hypothetical protein LARI1_G007777 [Lachnellula arida]|uniref:Uncharacterized protein n=1 Tax=Lachnellula arida TaxID=1316785 RepID=A0A8T9B445_9HELO|nr:hypothetical protein LARI1_G007777 [Lachnellula arida]
MSASGEAPLVILQGTPAFLGFVEKAARDTHNKTSSTREKLAKLDFTSSCEDVHKEFKRSYLDKIQPGSSTAMILDPNKIKSYWQPTPWVLTGGSFRIPSDISAVAIPLVKDGNPRIEYYDSRGVTSPVDWNVGSVIYLAGDASLITDGRGNTSFIFIMFTMDT